MMLSGLISIGIVLLPSITAVVVDDTATDGTSSTDCQSRINHHRTKYSVSLITERTELHSCVNRQSQYDKAVGVHESYWRCE